MITATPRGPRRTLPVERREVGLLGERLEDGLELHLLGVVGELHGLGVPRLPLHTSS